MTEADEIASNMSEPTRLLSFDEALAIVKREMPDESMTVQSNTAEALMMRSRLATDSKTTINKPLWCSDRFVLDDLRR